MLFFGQFVVSDMNSQFMEVQCIDASDTASGCLGRYVCKSYL